MVCTAWVPYLLVALLVLYLLQGSQAFASILALICISLFLVKIAHASLDASKGLLLGANLAGKDLCKPNTPILPEAYGVVAGTLYLVALFLFIPFFFSSELHTLGLLSPFATPDNDLNIDLEISANSYKAFLQYLVSILAICCMVMLGFCDDVFNLRWRYKLVLPLISSLPLLLIYALNHETTKIRIPALLLFNQYPTPAFVDLGPFFFVYIACLSIFSTNAINILAGINGVEAGQVTVITGFIVLKCAIELSSAKWGDVSSSKSIAQYAYLSLSLILPLHLISLFVYNHNKFPAQVFVGDTFCYFTGTAIAVSGIFGHFSKTLLLFLAPQLLNFFVSIPQLLKIIPCPRHRMPVYDSKAGLLCASRFNMSHSELISAPRHTLLLLRLLRCMHLAHPTGDDRSLGAAGLTITNITLLNIVLVVFGPMHEETLCNIIMGIQTASCSFALMAFFSAT